MRGCDIAPYLVPRSLASLGAFPYLLVSRYSLRSMTSHPVPRFARYLDGSQGFMKKLRLAGSFMETLLASLEGYHDLGLTSPPQLVLVARDRIFAVPRKMPISFKYVYSDTEPVKKLVNCTVLVTRGPVKRGDTTTDHKGWAHLLLIHELNGTVPLALCL